MDAYLVCFGLGASGLTLMALGGLGGRHGGRDNDVGSVSLPGHGHGGGFAAPGHGHPGVGAVGPGHGHGGAALGPGQGHGGAAGGLGHGGGGSAASAGQGAGAGSPLALVGPTGPAPGASAGAAPAAAPSPGVAAHPVAALSLRAGRGAGRAPGVRGAVTAHLLAWLSPRVLFSVLVGFGATGLLGRAFVGGAWLFGAALAGGFGFERLLVAPLWHFLLRFGSSPARTLDSALFEEARAVTHFDARGEGLVAIELDGHFVQVLGTLRRDPRGPGARVRAGDRLIVEEVDAARNRCTVARR